MFSRSLLISLLLSTPVALAIGFDFRVEPDQNNVTAGRLYGNWEADPVVSERLGTKLPKDTIEFTEDQSFLAELPAQYEKFLKDKQIFESGVVTWRRDGRVVRGGPYILITHSGNPHLVYFRDRDGVAMGDAESANIFVGQGKERQQDLLLLGGDFNNEAFRAYRRVSKDG
ncbi:MAG: hypothetical protein ACI841_005014 [Planctomycetota bacterium]|jgi:hypothetical protein